MEHYEAEIKKEFQLERIIFFSDAVFAIAITLLVIDLRIPYEEGFTNVDLLQAVVNKIPELIGFFISFFFIGACWVKHHKLFSFVKTFDTRLIWLNMFLLLSIVLLPFTTGIFGMYGNLTAAFCIYILNAVFAGVMDYLCWKHILNPKKKLAISNLDDHFKKTVFISSLLMPGWFFICGIMALIFNSYIGEMLMPVVTVLYIVVKRKNNIKAVKHR
ncbi:MAG: DUF1211 domain-containing protein [Bacteroidetes bacterium]|nr:DUF1211 domain-containing protein [Bacteroidota bacterium]